MIPGPNQIIACPHCGGLAKHRTLRSGNTFGARTWTDGKQIAPMLPCPPAVVKCLHCTKSYWLADAKQVGTVDSFAKENQHTNPDWVAAEFVKEPSEQEYYRALEEGLATNALQERNLRVFAWWRSNDAFRKAYHPLKENQHDFEARRINLNALARLLKEKRADERLLKAEILRELGEFESAKQLLLGIEAGELAGIAKQVIRLCEARDKIVRLL